MYDFYFKHFFPRSTYVTYYKGKLVPVLNQVPRHEDIFCSYTSTTSWRCILCL